MPSWKLKEKPGDEGRIGFPADVPAPLVEAIRNRGIETEQDLRLFLNPPHSLPYCPMRLAGMEEALRRLRSTLSTASQGGPTASVGIVGDFDVDGITGAAILVEGLSAFGIDSIPYLPHRISEGHGLSEEAVRFFSGHGVELIITVDCGVSSINEVELARSHDIKVIITDHHSPPAILPRAAAIINPAMPGNEYPFPDLCGAGLALKLVHGLYQLMGQPTPQSLLELAALGTIADMVPLVDENRYLVKEGLRALAQTQRPGLKAMYSLARLEDKAVTAETVAFQIAPRLNAAGRMGHAMDSLRLLTTQSHSEAKSLASGLEKQNRERQQLTRRALTAASAWIDGLAEVPSIILLKDPAITPGIAGLVAGQLSSIYTRPAVALAEVDECTLIASGRSIPEFNLVKAFDTCADLFVRYGGHAQAAGFTISLPMVPELEQRLTQLARDEFRDRELETSLEIDAVVSLSDLTPRFLEMLAELEPFGTGNPRPLFLARQLKVLNQWVMGNAGQHLKLLVSSGRNQFPALIFHRAEEWPQSATSVDLVFGISVDTWQGKRQVNLMVEDFRPSGGNN